MAVCLRGEMPDSIGIRSFCKQTPPKATSFYKISSFRLKQKLFSVYILAFKAI